MTRDQAYATLHSLIKNPNLIKHHLACEAAMRTIGLYLKSKQDSAINIEDWGIVGLLHDADYELTHEMPEKHTIILEERIGRDLKPEIIYSIKSHNWKLNNIEPKSLMDWAIYTCDELTGIIIAAALVRPDKKLSSVTVDFILQKLSEKSFAKAVDREQIKMCEAKLGITLSEYVGIVLKAMQHASAFLGL